MTENKGTGIADVDGSEMRLFERPVDLPEKVVVVDGKLGKEIGFVEREKVMELLEKDQRYTGFEDGCTGKFMLSYDSDGARKSCIQLETDNVTTFVSVVERELETAVGADDPKKLCLGVSYERKGRAYVLFFHCSKVYGVAKYLAADIAGSLFAPGVAGDGGPTERLIAALRKRNEG